MRSLSFAASAATLLLAASPVLAQRTQDSGLRVLPQIGADGVGDGSSVTVRYGSVQQVPQPGQGMCYRARFDAPDALFWGALPRELDASQYDGVYFKVKNLGSVPMNPEIGLHNYFNGRDSGRVVVALPLAPGETKTFLMYFNQQWMGKQMTIAPPKLDVPAQVMSYPATWNFNPSRITGWFVWSGGLPSTVEVQDVRLVKARRDLTGLIDKYGQDADLGGDWKVSDDGDLLARDVSERNILASTADAPTAVGSQALGSLKATGKWRFERSASGNWFPVDPNGNRSWFVGANNVYMDGRMVLEGKEEMYQTLPDSGGEYGQFFGSAPYFPTGAWQRTFDMYRANLYRKFGGNYEAQWHSRIAQRMRKWGVNAVAGTLDNGVVRDQRVPYMNWIFMYYFPVKLNVPQPYWTSPNDPWAPSFAGWCDSQFRTNFAWEIANNPSNLIGLCIGNEETWGFVNDERSTYQIPFAALNAPSTQPCKAPMVALLQAKYGTIARFNAAWGTGLASWGQLTASGVGQPAITPAMRTDLKAMLTAYADKYYGSIRGSLARIGYKGLFLGSRDALDQTPDAVLDVISKYADAVTINNYESDDATWNRIARLTKPVILSEFSYAAVDRGHWCGNKNWEVGSQADRGARVGGYFARAASIRNVCGAFMHAFAETPFTGRWSDNERMNTGLVDMTDQPYWEVVSAFRNFGTTLPALRRR